MTPLDIDALDDETALAMALLLGIELVDYSTKLDLRPIFLKYYNGWAGWFSTKGDAAREFLRTHYATIGP